MKSTIRRSAAFFGQLPIYIDFEIIDEACYRLIHLARFIEAVYVLHAFQKKSQKTSRVDLELARHRFRLLIQDRRQR